MSNQRGIVCVADYDASDSFCASVGMERICWNEVSVTERLLHLTVTNAEACPVAVQEEKGDYGSTTFLFNVLSLTRLRSLRDCLAEERHKLSIAATQTSGQRIRSSLDHVNCRTCPW